MADRLRMLGTIAAVVPTAIILAVYLPAAGHGFVSDDFKWVLTSRIDAIGDVPRLFQHTDGFYRPAVALTFGVNRLLSGLDPHPYGWTNVGLVLVTALLIRQLAIALGLTKGPATAAASLWFLNFHGINMSILWICGRTSLLVALAATASALCIVHRRMGWALLCLALALFSKEEALTLPVVLAGWVYLLSTGDEAARWRRVATWLLPATAIVAVYLVLRSSAGAMTPATAPSFYRFTFAPASLVRNVLEYTDRAVTTSAIAVLLGFILLRAKGVRLEPGEGRTILCGALWLVGGFGITVFLPIRSSLYAVVPSIGACLAAATLLDSFWRSAATPHRQRALVASIVLPICLIPVYHARAQGSVRLSDLSAQVVRDIVNETRNLPDDSTVLIVDDPTASANVAAVFGGLLNEAVLLQTGRRLDMRIVPPSEAGPAVNPPCETCVRLRLRLVGGRLVALP